MKRRALAVLGLVAASATFGPRAEAGQYKNFRAAIYVTRDTVRRWANADTLKGDVDAMRQQVKFDKVYLEFATARQFVDEASLDPIIKYFKDQGILVSGATALNGGGGQGRDAKNSSLSYYDDADRAFVKNVAEMAARHFDELILDDWYFTGSKTPADIAAKGTKSWTEHRVATMNAATEDLLLRPAKAINAKIRVIIKYPNWYEHYQALGYDLEGEPKKFDAIYTGVETRDPVDTEQHLQQYLSYDIGRYLENVAPGRNDGAWVDQLQTDYIDRYAEEIWNAGFAKPREITLWQWNGAAGPIRVGTRPWESTATSLDYKAMAATYHGTTQPSTGHVAGYAMEQVDAILGKLGKPIGIAGYRPPHAIGEEFLYDYLGMSGVPIELHPDFPVDADTCLLTEAAKNDPDVVAKIKRQLLDGKNVIITSGLLRALNKELNDITELEYTDQKVGVTRFQARGGRPVTGDPRLAEPLFIPVIHFITNQSWSQVSGLSGVAPQNGYPLVITDYYGKGELMVLTIPDNPADLYRLPPAVLGAIRNQLMSRFPVRLGSAAGQTALFAYDNDTFIVESYLPEKTTVTVTLAGPFSAIKDLVSDDSVAKDPPATQPTSRRNGGNGGGGNRNGPQNAGTSFTVEIPAHSFRAFAAVK